MKTVCVSASKKYDIVIDRGILSRCGEIIKRSCPKSIKAAIITDDVVDSLYSSVAENSLLDAGFDVCKYVFKNGEESKNFSNLGDILEFLGEKGLTRSDVIVALGGGVVGDIAGLSASLFLRGISFVGIPTTLLAMVDSSVGGKTAVNLSSGKNLAGAFYQPSLVLCDPDTLSTLPSHKFADGAAEAIKYAVIKDKELFEILKTNDIMEYAEDIIERCVAIKAEIVENDEKDLGIRQLLNFGHTIGHAIEKCSGFKITHGHAVSIGMVIISKAYGKSELLDELLALLSKYNLPSSCRFNADELYAASLSDKKRHGGSICIVVPEEIGNCVLKEIPIDELRGFIEKGVSI